jgi:hypothetical protein
VFQINPRSGKKSRFPLGFRGCLGCGGDHKFGTCEGKEVPEVKAAFYENYGAQKVSIPEARELREKSHAIVHVQTGIKSLEPSPKKRKESMSVYGLWAGSRKI